MTDTPATAQVTALYRALLAAWDARDAKAFASLFGEGGLVVGFDGSQMIARAEVETTLAGIFSDHPTGRYVAKVRSVRSPAAGVAILHAVAGLVPPGQSEPHPDRNAVQVLVAHREGDAWSIDSFQNTPAAFHGRPDAVQALTEELRKEK